MSIEVLYCDNHLFVAKKPSGIPTQATSLEEGFHEVAKRFIAKEFNKPDNVFLEPIYRLDKSVEGIVVFARTSKALSRLMEMMREKKFSKNYIAIIEGYLPNKEGILEDYLIHDDYRAKIVSEKEKSAKKAVLRYRVIKEHDQKSEIEIFLETGRYHQIRVQFSSRGFPILGDKKYGARNNLSKNQIALFHTKIAFPHPTKQEPLCFQINPSIFFL